LKELLHRIADDPTRREAQCADHSEQSIDAFGPNGEDITIPNEISVRYWYDAIHASELQQRISLK